MCGGAWGDRSGQRTNIRNGYRHRDLTARGLSGVRLVASDAHAGLVAAIGAMLPGVHAQFDRVLDAVADKLSKVSEHLDAGRADALTFTNFPKELWRQIWSNDPSDRLNREIRLRTDVVVIFPDRNSLICASRRSWPSSTTSGSKPPLPRP